jgi:hypothetical protein
VGNLKPLQVDEKQLVGMWLFKVKTFAVFKIDLYLLQALSGKLIALER